MAGWGYEFYLLVLKVSLTSERSGYQISSLEKILVFHQCLYNKKSYFSELRGSSKNIVHSSSFLQLLPQCS